MTSLLMVLDAGGGGGRCLITDTAGREIAFAYRPWTMRVPPGNPMGSVFDPEEWWSALVAAAHEALGKVAADAPGAGAGPPAAGAGRILAITTTSLRDAAVFLDADGKELYCGTNRDARAVGLGFEIAQNLGETQWRITGRWPLGLDPGARLLWHKRDRPEIYERVRNVLSINTWLTYRLSGAISIEPTSASSIGLFDVSRGLWSAELLTAHGFDPSLFPPVSWPGQVAGRLSRVAAAALGLVPGIPVVTGLADSQAGCLGSAAWAAGDTTVIAGTTAPVMQVTETPFRDPSHRIWAGAYAVPGRWVIESNAGLAGSVYSWYAALFGPGSGADQSAFAGLEEEVAAAPAAQILTWLGPNIADFSSLSFPMEATIKFPALGVFCTPTRGALARAILENVAYAIRGNLEQLPDRPDLVRVCGGLSRSQAFTHLLASVLNTPVVSPAVREATGIGAAVAASVGAGIYPDLATAARRMVELGEPVLPDPVLAGQYEAQYSVWKSGLRV
jgi:autoinducer 2 (AI-2) kinase